jgi:hypothetical protein
VGGVTNAVKEIAGDLPGRGRKKGAGWSYDPRQSDIFWFRAKSLEESDNLPVRMFQHRKTSKISKPPLGQFREIAGEVAGKVTSAEKEAE